MTRTPFDPMKSAAMREAQARNAVRNPDAPPLSPQEERALIESLANTAPDDLDARAQAEAEELLQLPAGTAAKPLSVRQLNALLNDVLTNTLPTTFHIAGELSNFRTYDRGHAFFTLKEQGAEIPCVIWKDALARLKFKPKDGLSVVARGNIKLYEPQGKIQLYVETLFAQGTGGLEIAFRQLCEKLKAEGLFEQARKRPLPALPLHIAIITSRTGDVLHDVLTTAYRRFPGLHTMLYPVRVQGDSAAPEIVNAIKQLNAHNNKIAAGELRTQDLGLSTPIDLILLVRGGGSLEDLWAFNEESVARAIVASAIPIATGIGHEPDTTIADLVGDLRGPTPTGVTELTIPHAATLLNDLDNKAALLTRDIRRMLQLHWMSLDRHTLHFMHATTSLVKRRTQRLDFLQRQIERIEPRHAIAQSWRILDETTRRITFTVTARHRLAHQCLAKLESRLTRVSLSPFVAREQQRLDNLHHRLQHAIARRQLTSQQKLAGLVNHLQAVSPQATLDRGYSITTAPDGSIVRSTTQVKKGDLLTTRVANGTIDSTVGKPKQSSLF